MVDLETAISEERVGAGVGISWLRRTNWMHRRVETFEFRAADVLHVHASIDLTIPYSAVAIKAKGVDFTGLTSRSLRVIPVAFLPKEELTTCFDLHDEDGRSLPRLRAEHAGQLGAQILKIMAGGSNRNLPLWLTEKFSKYASPEYMDDPLPELRDDSWGGDGELKDEVLSSSSFITWLQQLSKNTLLCVLISGEEGESRVIKYCYEKSIPSKGGAKHPTVAIGIKAWPVMIRTPSATDCRSYHCELIHPPDVLLQRVNLWRVDPRGGDSTKVAFRGERLLDRYHLFASRLQPVGEYSTVFEVRVKRDGWLRAAFFTSWAISLILFLGALFAHRFIGSEDPSKPGIHTDSIFLMGTLLLAAGAAAITILVRSDQHSLTTRMLKYLTYSAYLMVGLAFAAVLLLVLARDEFQLRLNLYILFGIGALMSLLLTWVLALGGSRSS